MMGYTDIQLRAFTQIAYMDLEASFTKYSVPEKTPVSLSKLLSDKEKSKLLNLGITEREINEWKIVAVHDANDVNGFYSCVIETAPGKAAVGFRGSEGMSEFDSVKNDWVYSDLGLLNSTCTIQHAETERFLEKYKDTLSKYDLTMTGHSLGGNLAEYATLVSSKYGLDDNISQCVSLDGPGFSDEFLASFRKEIEHMKGKMKHYRWSFVGSLLNDIPGVEYTYLEVNNFDQTENFDVMRHDTKYLTYDKSTGMFIKGEQDTLSKITSLISEGLDHLPKPIGDALLTIIGGTWIGIAWAKENMFDEDGNLTATGFGIIAGATALVAAIGVGTVVTAIVTTVVAMIAVVVVAIALEVIHDLVIATVNAVCDALEKIYKCAKEFVDQLRDAAISFINGIKEWFNKNFNYGAKYAEQHPQIRLDTSRLTSYADRLNRVNSRINAVDRRLDALYWQVGLLDLWNLMCADLLTGYSWRLSRCASALNSTASDFNQVERSITSKL